jgi:putative SOS response-associated peptidase YedK
MCGRITIIKRQEFNFAPTMLTDVTIWPKTWPAPGTAQMKWGIRSTFDDKLLINARIETAHQKSTFQGAFKLRRGLVIGDGFYEWQRFPFGKKIPYHITFPSGHDMEFGALWFEGEPQTFVALTIEAPTDFQWLHHRVPFLIHPDWRTAWLNERTPFDEILGMVKDYVSPEFICTAVNDRVNKASNNGPLNIAPREGTDDEDTLPPKPKRPRSPRPPKPGKPEEPGLF